MQEEIKDVLNILKDDIKNAITYLKSEYSVLKAGRANPHLLDKIMVDYYGTMTPLNQLGTISVPEARLLTISVWDLNAVGLIRKAIQTSDLGVSPTDDGKVIRLVFPPLTEERRREIVKQVKKLAEDAKISIRNARRECLDFFKTSKKDGVISENEYAGLEKEVQKIVDNANEEVDNLCEQKEKEVMEVWCLTLLLAKN